MSKIKDFVLSLIGQVKAFLMAHPKFKNWLDGLEKAVIASVLAYGAMIVNHLTDGTPLPVNLTHGLLVGIAGGFFIVISGAVKAYCQNLHDFITANNQDQLQAIAGGPENQTQVAAVMSDIVKSVPVATSSTLTPIVPKKP